MSQVCKKIQVRGRVQGVFFRAFTQKVAQDLSVSGWAQNEPDGSVLIMACGTLEQLEHFMLALHQGPPTAMVSAVEVTEAAMQTFNGFAIQH